MTYDRKDERINIGAGMVPTYHATESVEEAKAVVEQCRTATEELRRLLDERGAKYWDMGIRGIWFGINTDGSDHQYEAYDQINDLISIEAFDLTPEQAIAATLGAGTCRISVQDNLTETDGMGDVWLECDECHWQMPLEPSTPRFNYCPNCGRRAVDE